MKNFLLLLFFVVTYSYASITDYTVLAKNKTHTLIKLSDNSERIIQNKFFYCDTFRNKLGQFDNNLFENYSEGKRDIASNDLSSSDKITLNECIKPNFNYSKNDNVKISILKMIKLRLRSKELN